MLEQFRVSSFAPRAVSREQFGPLEQFPRGNCAYETALEQFKSRARLVCGGTPFGSTPLISIEPSRMIPYGPGKTLTGSGTVVGRPMAATPPPGKRLVKPGVNWSSSSPPLFMALTLSLIHI